MRPVLQRDRIGRSLRGGGRLRRYGSRLRRHRPLCRVQLEALADNVLQQRVRLLRLPDDVLLDRAPQQRALQEDGLDGDHDLGPRFCWRRSAPPRERARAHVGNVPAVGIRSICVLTVKQSA